MSSNTEGVPAACPGPNSARAGQEDTCQGCPSQKECLSAPKGPDPDIPAITQRLSSVKHKILILSGKGGVGKSTFSSQLSFALANTDTAQVGTRIEKIFIFLIFF